MSTPVGAAGGAPEESPKEEIALGELGEHKVTNQTQSASSLAHTVPKGTSTYEKSFTHQASVAWQRGGLLYVIQLIASYLHLCAPPFFIAKNEKTRITADLITYQAAGLKAESPDVQAVLDRLFPIKIEDFEKELAIIKRRNDVRALQPFIKRIEQAERDINTQATELEEYPFVANRKFVLLKNLNDIKLEARLIDLQNDWKVIKERPDLNTVTLILGRIERASPEEAKHPLKEEFETLKNEVEKKKTELENSATRRT